MSRPAIVASGHDQGRRALPAVRFGRPSHGRPARHPTGSLDLRGGAEKAGRVAAYGLSGMIYLGVLVSVFWF